MSNTGTQWERITEHYLAARGMIVVRAAASMGPWDLWAVGQGGDTWHVQVKFVGRGRLQDGVTQGRSRYKVELLEACRAARIASMGDNVCLLVVWCGGVAHVWSVALAGASVAWKWEPELGIHVTEWYESWAGQRKAAAKQRRLARTSV